MATPVTHWIKPGEDTPACGRYLAAYTTRSTRDVTCASCRKVVARLDREGHL